MNERLEKFKNDPHLQKMIEKRKKDIISQNEIDELIFLLKGNGKEEFEFLLKTQTCDKLIDTIISLYDGESYSIAIKGQDGSDTIDLDKIELTEQELSNCKNEQDIEDYKMFKYMEEYKASEEEIEKVKRNNKELIESLHPFEAIQKMRELRDKYCKKQLEE